jgi:hypothetical protein
MKSVYELKPRVQALLRPFVDRLVRAGGSPNQVTIDAMINVPLFFCFIGSSRNRVDELMANYLRWTVPPFRKGRLSMKLVKVF